MQGYEIVNIWFIGGIILMLLEVLLPGGIVFFLGLGAVLVSALLYAGLIEGWLQAFTVWFIGSLALVFGLRGVAQKFIPAQVEQGKTDEDLDAYDALAKVCEPIPAGGEGRIAFRGSTWKARNYRNDHNLDVGAEVRIIFRENLVWVVDAVETNKNTNETDSNNNSIK